MFATVLGSLPRPPSSDDESAVRAAIAAQESAGIELVSDGGAGSAASSVVDAWRFAASCTPLPVKATVLGPYTRARRFGGRPAEVAEVVRAGIDALAAVGCSLVEIDEPDAVLVGFDTAAREAFLDAHLRLATDAPVHLCLVLAGGNADDAGAATFVDPPYSSYAVDLVAGPDNWRLVADIPGDRGVVCGALRPTTSSDDSPELLVWAAHYAASTGGRGLDRVGLANAPGLDALPWEVAVRKLERLGEAARIAALPRTGELAAALDPRATDLRSRALGRRVPRPPRPPSPRRRSG